MRKMKQWPFGLLEDAFRSGTMKIDQSHDLVRSVEFAVNSLDEKFAVVLYDRYKYGLTLDAISQRHGSSKEQTRNTIEKGLRMLRHPANVMIIQYGIPGFLQVERNEEGDIETAVLQNELSAKYLQAMLEKAVQVAHNQDALQAKMNAAAWEAAYRAIKDE